jgi:hypothetical protein
MAEFSKQYCERYDWAMLPHADFDIDEVLNNMPNASYRAIICEGFGFTGIEKDEDGKPYCLFGDEWQGRVPLLEVNDTTYLKFK